MKLHPEDPRITAYVLGELGPDDAAAVEQAVAEDPELQIELGKTVAARQFLTSKLTLPGDTLLPRQRENIRRRARHTRGKTRFISLVGTAEALKPWLIPAAAAAVLSVATFILTRVPENKPAPIVTNPPAGVTAPAAVAPARVTKPNPPAPTPDLPVLSAHGSLAAAEFPTLDLPVFFGKSNLASISKSIINEQHLPAQNTVRLEEVLNQFSLRLNGTAAIARGAPVWHPDDRDGEVSPPVATLTTEMIGCPWKPSATLLLISIRGNDSSDSDVKITFHANVQNVVRYRLLGFTPGEGRIPGISLTHLPAKSITTLALEIEPSQPGSELGSLEWSTANKAAPSISLVHKKDAEPSDDARFAALVCTFAQWLAGEQAGIIDADIVSALAREIASTTLPADRADFLNLIDRSLHL